MVESKFQLAYSGCILPRENRKECPKCHALVAEVQMRGSRGLLLTQVRLGEDTEEEKFYTGALAATRQSLALVH